MFPNKNIQLFTFSAKMENAESEKLSKSEEEEQSRKDFAALDIKSRLTLSSEPEDLRPQTNGLHQANGLCELTAPELESTLDPLSQSNSLDTSHLKQLSNGTHVFSQYLQSVLMDSCFLQKSQEKRRRRRTTGKTAIFNMIAIVVNCRCRTS